MGRLILSHYNAAGNNAAGNAVGMILRLIMDEITTYAQSAAEPLVYRLATAEDIHVES